MPNGGKGFSVSMPLFSWPLRTNVKNISQMTIECPQVFCLVVFVVGFLFFLRIDLINQTQGEKKNRRRRRQSLSNFARIIRYFEEGLLSLFILKLSLFRFMLSSVHYYSLLSLIPFYRDFLSIFCST